MLNLDPSKIAKNAVDGLQKAEKLGGGAGEAAKGVLQGIKKAEELTDLEKAPEEVIAALRKLLAEAEQLSGSSTNKNEALDACIKKARALLDGGNISTKAVAELTAELSALIKGAPASASQQTGGQRASASPAAAKAAPTPAANVRKDTAMKHEAQPPAAKAAEAAAKKTVQFSDVDANAYYYDAVQWAVQQGIVSGTSETTFSPDQECTCGQAVTLLWRAAGSPTPKGKTNPFADVKEDVYYYQPALWAAERGIISGTALRPDEPVTRGQFATLLYRNAGSPAVESKSGFTDIPGDASYAQAVNWVAAQGIASGTGEHTFSPDTICTRGQIVTFLYRAKK